MPALVQLGLPGVSVAHEDLPGRPGLIGPVLDDDRDLEVPRQRAGQLVEVSSLANRDLTGPVPIDDLRGPRAGQDHNAIDGRHWSSSSRSGVAES